MARESSRRRFLRGAAGVAVLLLVPRALRAAARPLPRRRELAFAHLHTGERLEIAYRERGEYVPEALAHLDHLLRDHRTGEVHPIDPALFDLLHDVRAATDGSVFEVISGFRSAATNEMLRAQGGWIADKEPPPRGEGDRRAPARRRDGAAPPRSARARARRRRLLSGSGLRPPRHRTRALVVSAAG